MTVLYDNDAPSMDTAMPLGQKCVTVIFNPVSGQGDPAARQKAIEEALAQHGYGCQHLVTTLEQGARYFAEQALNDGADLIVVSGGDGTIMEVLTALIGTNIPVAILPAGTGNLLSLNLGLPRNITEAIDAALFGQRRAIDLARITTPDNDGSAGDNTRHFAILAGAGYDAWVIRDADRETKKRLGLGAYLWSALRNLKRRPVKARIRIDDSEKTRTRRAKSIMVANMGRLQANVEVVPDSHPDDGVLEVAVLKAETLSQWVRLTWNALRHRLHDDPSVEFHKARKVSVELSAPQPMQFDGEESDSRHRRFTVEVLPRAVEIMVPRSSSL